MDCFTALRKFSAYIVSKIHSMLITFTLDYLYLTNIVK